MAKIYISSTYKDLKEYREAVYRALHKLEGHEIRAMEDYVAADIRPLAKCRKDVEQCDVYIGLIAWRYGYIPENDNPEKKSITELEFQAARTAGRECLIFMLPPEAPWPAIWMDSNTGDAEAGKQIAQFRGLLEKSLLVSPFNNADQLAGLVNTAVSNWEKSKGEAAPCETPKDPVSGGAPQLREVKYSIFLGCSPLDQDLVSPWAKQLGTRGLKLLLNPRALFAETEVDFQNLEKSLIQCHSALIIITLEGFDQLKSRGSITTNIMRMMKNRTGYLGGLLVGVNRKDLPLDWPLTEIFDAVDTQSLVGKKGDVLTGQIVKAVVSRSPDSSFGTVGLPVTVVAMTQEELKDLISRPDQIRERMGSITFDKFKALCQELEKNQAGWNNRYAGLREQWKPFTHDGPTVEEIVLEIATNLNERILSELRQRLVKIQFYPFDPVKKKDPQLRCIYRDIAQTGCVIIVDEMSMFYPELRDAFRDSQFFNSPQVAIVTVSPFDPGRSSVNQILELETRSKLAGAFDRFALDYDPQCEFAVGDERRLRRWLHSSLPETMRSLREPRPDRSALRHFANEVGRSPAGPGITELLFAGRGKP